MPSASKKKQPQDRRASQSRYGSSWKKPLTDLQLPSGELCQVRRPGVQGLIKAGVLQSMDSLTAIVQTETIPKAEGRPVTNVKEIVNDPDKFGKMMTLVDKIVSHVVVQPKVSLGMRPVIEDGVAKVDDEGDPILEEIPDEEKERLADEWAEENPDKPPLIFTDWIDSVDKMFIMNFAVGGSADLAEFRAQTEALMGGVPDGEAAPSEAE